VARSVDESSRIIGHASVSGDVFATTQHHDPQARHLGWDVWAVVVVARRGLSWSQSEGQQPMGGHH